MTDVTRRRVYRASSVFAFAASTALLAACANNNTMGMVHHGKEYFSESAYGVKASPRVSPREARLHSRVGREQVGTPYEVRGKWYYPKDYKRFQAVGLASWYGSAFDGRLTANGEVYDMDDLTAANPTMPLPSYARVTNLENGSSLVVRVNDRGPYAPGRVIDLSKRAAEMLNYRDDGVAKVKVQYIGRAPVERHDERYLMASYNPGRFSSPQDDLGGTMVAMNGPTPTSGTSALARAFPGPMATVPLPSSPPFTATDAPTPVRTAAYDQTATASLAPPSSFDDSDPVLPSVGPIVPERPDLAVASAVATTRPAVLSYADGSAKRSDPFEAIIGARAMSASDVVASWKRERAVPHEAGHSSYVLVGTFASADEAAKHARVLARFGRPALKHLAHDGRDWYSVDLYPDGRAPVDTMLQEAWADGASDAMTVRD